MDLRNYLAETTDESDLLEFWRWTVPANLTLWRATKFGDAILRDPSTGSVHLLETIESTLQQIAESIEEFEAKACDPERLDRWLLAGLVDAAAARGMSPGPGECLGFKLPPSLGAPISLENVQVFSLVVYFAVTGQLLQQTRDLPPGTEIVGFRLAESKPSIWRRVRNAILPWRQ